jgi:uncharacterized membrane protein YfcA
VFFALVGGWVSGALGLGGGSIFNPLLLSLGLPPSVSSSTGMYLILYSTAASSIMYLINKMLAYDFAVWIGGWCCVGTIAGLKVMNYFTKKYERQSYIVLLLAIIFIFSTFCVPFFAFEDIIAQYNLGKNVFKFKSFC